MPDQWIVIPNWERFQHYKHRNPPWIKLYRSLLSKDEFLELSDACKGLLMTIWLAYAEHQRELTVDMLRTYSLKTGVQYRNLASLNQAGFIQLSASKVASKSPLYSERLTSIDARARVQEEQKSVRRAENWIRNGAADEIPTGHLAEVIADEFHIKDPQLVDELVAQAQAHR